jgi:hypothetical protein
MMELCWEKTNHHKKVILDHEYGQSHNPFAHFDVAILPVSLSRYDVVLQNP